MRKYYGIIFFITVCVLTGINLYPTHKYKLGDCVVNGIYHFNIVEVDKNTYTIENKYIRLSDTHRMVEKIFWKVDNNVCNR